MATRSRIRLGSSVDTLFDADEPHIDKVGDYLRSNNVVRIYVNSFEWLQAEKLTEGRYRLCWCHDGEKFQLANEGISNATEILQGYRRGNMASIIDCYDWGKKAPSLIAAEVDSSAVTPNAAAAGGWLYVLANAAMGGFVKIGRTDRSPKDRVAELSAATGVPTPFVLVWQEAVSDPEAAERDIHALLASSRLSLGREFFAVEVKAAIEAVSSVANRYAINDEIANSSSATNGSSYDRFIEQQARDQSLLVDAVRLLARTRGKYPAGIDPRILRVELKCDFSESRRLFQYLQDLGMIDKAGVRLR